MRHTSFSNAFVGDPEPLILFQAHKELCSDILHFALLATYFFLYSNKEVGKKMPLLLTLPLSKQQIGVPENCSKTIK